MEGPAILIDASDQFEFLRQLSSDPANTVIGLARNKEATDIKTAELKRTNVHILEGDLINYDSLKVFRVTRSARAR